MFIPLESLRFAGTYLVHHMSHVALRVHLKWKCLTGTITKVGWIFANELAVGLSNKFTQEFLGSYSES